MTPANDTATSGQVRVHAVRIVTDDPAPLVAFYDTLLGTSTPAPGPYTEIPTETGVHVSFSRREALEEVLPAAALDAAVRRGILDVEVDDVDAHVNMLRAAGAAIVEEPSQRPWGARAATVADPDGRIINVFAPARGR